ncbi:MAG: plasmid mobilization relaxosome protein MobC [Eggerthellaceae bacterium]|nr:plasmid mobilization relaxosome protein MobC [Eggerthellaceae bacterium]
MKKQSWLTIRLSQSDLDHIKEKAHDANVSVSEYVRSKCTSDSSKPCIVVDRQLIADLLVSLKREGNNLNQLTRYVHSRGVDTKTTQSLNDSLQAVTKTAEEVSRFLIDSRNQL